MACMKFDLGIFLICLSWLFLLALVVGSPFIMWYFAKCQSEVFHRQGIEITPWECFIGVRPAGFIPPSSGKTK